MPPVLMMSVWACTSCLPSLIVGTCSGRPWHGIIHFDVAEVARFFSHMLVVVVCTAVVAILIYHIVHGVSVCG